MAIIRVDKDTVRIYHNGIWHYIEVSEEHNLIVVERVFIRGFDEGRKVTKDR